MSKKPIQPQDKYVLRLPDGLRDRIKDRASLTGRSMNTEIVRVLEKEFPEPMNLDSQLQHLLDLFTALRKVRGYEGAISGITDAVRDTVEAIATGRVPNVDENTRAQVRQTLDEWYDEQIKEERDRRDAAEFRYLQSQIDYDDDPGFPDHDDK
ncbi:Arc family DNA-binding protein [Paenochrobactrum sp. BZR 201-1]